MQNNDQHIDKAFNQKLANIEVNPPTEVWDRISNSMGYSRKRRIGFWLIGFSSAASLLFAFAMGWYFANVGVENERIYSQLESVTLQPTAIIDVMLPVAKNNNKQISPSQFARSVQPLEKSSSKKSMDTSIANNRLVKSNDNNNLTTFLSPAKPVLIFQNGLQANLATMNSNNDGELSAFDLEIIESNLLAMNSSKDIEIEKKQGEWAVGLQGSPISHFDQPSFGKTYDAITPDYNLAQNNVTTNYTTNFSGGIMVEYATGNRFSVQTGVNYAELAQNGGEIGISFDTRNWVNDRGEMVYQDAELPSKGSLGLPNSDNQVVLNTQVGLANITMKQGATLASSKNSISLAPEVTQNFEYQQQARYVEVPMILRYRLIDKRIGMHLLGGINTNFLVDNLVQLVNQSDVIANGKIEGLRTVSFSSSMGIGVNYELSKRFNLSFEPTLKLQLNSLNANSNFDSRPYAFGIFSGLAYRF